MPVTSTQALCSATLPYVLCLADKGLEGAVGAMPDLRRGVNVRDGAVVNEAVQEALGG